MSRIRIIGLAIVAVFAFSVVASASASAHTFKATAAPTKVTGVQTNNQVFVAKTGKEVICKNAAASGEAKEPSEEITAQTVNYTECTAFGQPTKISTAHYKVSAAGTVEIVEPIVITVEGLGGGCTVTVSGKQTLGTLTFANEGGKILETSNVTGIHSKPSGGFCGSATEEFTEGTYTGSIRETAEKGEISWE